MAPPSLADLIDQMNFAVQSIEVRFGVGEVLVSDIEDLKEGIDTARLRLWALMQSPAAQDRLGYEERFRMRRARELCGRLAEDLAAGKIATRHPEFTELAATSQKLAKAIAAASKEKPARASTRTPRSPDKGK